MARTATTLVRDRLALPAGMHVTLQMPPDPTPADFALAQGLGVRTATAWINDLNATPDDYARRSAAFAAAGLTLYGLGNGAVHNQEDIVLALPERDAKIEAYQRHLRHLAAAGIPYATYAHMANGIWSPARETSRGASARAYDNALAASATAVGTWNGQLRSGALTHGR